MSASFYDLLKYAATGIASPDMTYYDKMRASTLMGGVVQTLTGIPPLTFKADGTPLISWSMKGNGSQTGTPTHDAPIMPTFCGVRTAQIIDYTLSESGGIDASGNPVAAVNLWRANIFYEIHGDIALSFVQYSTLLAVRVNYYDADYTHISREQINVGSASGVSIIIPANAKYFKWTLYAQSGSTIDIDFVRQCYIMFNTGSTALPYEPYGWAEKITCAGQTTSVYLGQVSTVRKIRKLVLTGEENWQSSAVTGGLAFLHFPTSAAKDADSANVLSTHYKPQYRNNDGNVYLTNHRIVIVDFSFDSVDTFKAYLAAQYAAGTPVTVWYVLETPETGIVNEPLCKIGDYADELHSEDAGVSIPTIKGSNTLTVDTELQPSEMTITYKG